MAEEPRFTPVLKEGPFELRDYPARTEARVTLDTPRENALNSGFSVLASYIFGSNEGRQKIDMTTPVLLAPEGSGPNPDPATADWVVSFIMPPGRAAKEMPAPADPRVRLLDFAPQRMATIRFSGSSGPDKVEQKRAELARWMTAHNLIPAGPPSLARYDPPWKPPFLRRNEVMIPVAAA